MAWYNSSIELNCIKNNYKKLNQAILHILFINTPIQIAIA